MWHFYDHDYLSFLKIFLVEEIAEIIPWENPWRKEKISTQCDMSVLILEKKAPLIETHFSAHMNCIWGTDKELSTMWFGNVCSRKASGFQTKKYVANLKNISV